MYYNKSYLGKNILFYSVGHWQLCVLALISVGRRWGSTAGICISQLTMTNQIAAFSRSCFFPLWLNTAKDHKGQQRSITKTVKEH